jgi:hypothetical protein
MSTLPSHLLMNTHDVDEIAARDPKWLLEEKWMIKSGWKRVVSVRSNPRKRKRDRGHQRSRAALLVRVGLAALLGLGLISTTSMSESGSTLAVVDSLGWSSIPSFPLPFLSACFSCLHSADKDIILWFISSRRPATFSWLHNRSRSNLLDPAAFLVFCCCYTRPSQTIMLKEEVTETLLRFAGKRCPDLT